MKLYIEKLMIIFNIEFTGFRENKEVLDFLRKKITALR